MQRTGGGCDGMTRISPRRLGKGGPRGAGTGWVFKVRSHGTNRATGECDVRCDWGQEEYD